MLLAHYPLSKLNKEDVWEWEQERERDGERQRGVGVEENPSMRFDVLCFVENPLDKNHLSQPSRSSSSLSDCG